MEPSTDEWELIQIGGDDGLVHGYARKKKVCAIPADFRFRAWLTFHFEAEPNFMPSSEDMQAFSTFEESLFDGPESAGLATLVAVVTLEGKRDHLIYFRDKDAVLHSLGELTKPYLRFRPNVEVSLDPDRAEWRELFA